MFDYYFFHCVTTGGAELLGARMRHHRLDCAVHKLQATSDKPLQTGTRKAILNPLCNYSRLKENLYTLKKA